MLMECHRAMPSPVCVQINSKIYAAEGQHLSTAIRLLAHLGGLWPGHFPCPRCFLGWCQRPGTLLARGTVQVPGAGDWGPGLKSPLQSGLKIT